MRLKRILVIEDDEACRAAVRAALAGTQAEVIEAADGTSGLALAGACKPDLVICDVHMQGVSGWDVLAGLRVGASTATVPVIMMTASHEAKDMRRSMNLGADDFLQKPFSREELLAAVEARRQRRAILGQEIERTHQQMRQLLESMENLIAVVDTHPSP